MKNNAEDAVRKALRDFLRRDYRADVRRLNGELSINGHDAGLREELAPIIFTGNPFARTIRGNCIAILGLNPKWLEGDQFHFEREYSPLTKVVDRIRENTAEIDDYVELRSRYFSETNDYYYWPYYSKLGSLVGRQWFGVPDGWSSRKSATWTFSNHVFHADLLPWFSGKTNRIDPAKLHVSNPILGEYMNLLGAFFALVQPRWIQFNGVQGRKLIEATFETTLHEQVVEGKGLLPQTCYFGWAEHLGGPKKPIFVHAFTNSAKGPQSQARFNAVAEAFQRWVNQPEIFTFERRAPFQ